MGLLDALERQYLREAASREAVREAERLAEARRCLRGRSLPEMRLVADYLQGYSYDWPPDVRSECRVRVYEECEGGLPPAAVLTDLARGISVVNQIEEIAARVTVRCMLPAGTLWVIHLPRDYPHQRIGEKAEHYSLITFAPKPDASGYYTDVEPVYRWLTAADTDRLRYWLPLGEEVSSR